MVRKQDQIYGCLLGAAAGDALGFCVEELTLEDIHEKYGPDGIQGYDTVNGFATVSSHTQLAMFTANGLLFGATRGATRGVMAPYVQYLEAAYRDWSKTQHYGGWKNREKCYCWLCSLEPLYSRRNPEPAVLYALERPQAGTMEEPVNRSQGPNGMARSIPIGLFFHPTETSPSEIRLLGAESAALTHGDPLGFLPAAYLTDLLNRIVYRNAESFRSVLKRTRTAMSQYFGSRFSQIRTLESKLDWAEAMAETSTSPEEALSQQRPTDAASVLASACYICLKYPGDYDRGIVAAVNHSGLSSALGAVTGALLGAQVGTEGIPEFYLEPLEFREILTELASDLFQGCPMSRNARLFDDQWDQKYIQCHY